MARSIAGMKLTLTYIPVRALAEPLRIMANYGGVKMEEDIIGNNVDIFRSMSPSEKAEYSITEQLPSLKVQYNNGDSFKISQSGACMRFLGSQIHDDFYPSDPIRRAKVDEAFEMANEFGPINQIVNIVAAGRLRDAREKEFFGPTFDRRLRYCVRALDGQSFFCGDKPTIADFQFLHYADHCLLVRPSCLDEYPSIAEWVKRMTSLPAVAKYLDERPQVGTGNELGRPDTYIRGK